MRNIYTHTRTQRIIPYHRCKKCDPQQIIPGFQENVHGHFVHLVLLLGERVYRWQTTGEQDS